MGNDYDDALKTIAKGAGIAFVGGIIGQALGFLSRVLIARFLTPNLYGVLSLALAVFSICVLISLMGIPEGLRRYISYYLGRGSYSKVRGVLVSSIRLTLPTAIFVSALMFITSERVSTTLFHNLELSPVLKIFAIGLPFWVLAKIFIEANVGFKRVDYKIAAEFIQQVTKILSVLVFLIAGLGLMGASYGYLLSFFLGPVIGYYYLKKSLTFDSHYDTVDRELLLYSWPLMLASFSQMILSWTDTIMLGYFKTEFEVGIYNAAYPIAQLLTLFGISFAIIFLPVITEFYSRRDMENLKRVYRTTTKWIITLTFPFFLLVLLFGRWAIYFLFGPEYVSGYNALSILSVGFFLNSTFILSRKILNSIARTKIVMTVSYLSASANVILNYLLIPKFGIIGASAATSISLAFSSILSFYMAHNLVEINPFSKKSMLAIAISSVALLFIYILIKIIKIELNICLILLAVVMYVIIYFILLVLFKFFDKEDKVIFKAFRDKVGTILK